MNTYSWYDKLDLFGPRGRPYQSQHRRRKMNGFAESLRREVFGAITRKLTTIVSNAEHLSKNAQVLSKIFTMSDNITPPGMRLCAFCGSLVPEWQYLMHKYEISKKGGQALRGSAAAHEKARKAARARWSRPPRQTKK
jgi:hypothetical protein